MSNTGRLLAALALAGLGLPALADSYPDASYASAEAPWIKAAPADVKAPAGAIRGKASGFEFIAGETGSQPTQHKLAWKGGRFVHSDECDHAIRVVKGPTADEVERARLASPGA